MSAPLNREPISPSTEAGWRKVVLRIAAVGTVMNTIVVVVAAGAGHAPGWGTLLSMVGCALLVVPEVWRASR